MASAYWTSHAEMELEEILRYIREEGQRLKHPDAWALRFATRRTSMYDAAYRGVGIPRLRKIGFTLNTSGGLSLTFR